MRSSLARRPKHRPGSAQPPDHMGIIALFSVNHQSIAVVTPSINDFIELQALRLSIFPKEAKKTVLFPAMIT